MTERDLSVQYPLSELAARSIPMYDVLRNAMIDQIHIADHRRARVTFGQCSTILTRVRCHDILRAVSIKAVDYVRHTHGWLRAL